MLGVRQGQFVFSYYATLKISKTVPTSIGLKQKIQHGHINQEVFNKYEKLGEEIT